MKERTGREEEELRMVENMRKLENATCAVSNTAKRSMCDEFDEMLTVFNVKQIDSMKTNSALSSTFSQCSLHSMLVFTRWKYIL